MKLPISDEDRKGLAAVAAGRQPVHDFNECVARVLNTFIRVAEEMDEAPEAEPVEIAPDVNPEPPAA